MMVILECSLNVLSEIDMQQHSRNTNSCYWIFSLNLKSDISSLFLVCNSLCHKGILKMPTVCILIALKSLSFPLTLNTN